MFRYRFPVVSFIMNFLAWNIRGASCRNLPRLIKDLEACYRFHFLALFETRVSGNKVDAIIKRLGFDEWFKVDAVGFSGGIWILWNSNFLKAEVLRAHSQYVHLKISPSSGLPSSLLTCVYASPRLAGRAILWNELRQLAENIQEPWAAIGDFNSYLAKNEKSGGAEPNWQSMESFGSCLRDCGLWDLGYTGPPFTWEWRGVKERLDRVVCNNS